MHDKLCVDKAWFAQGRATRQHLRQILPSIAVYGVLRAQGVPQARAVAVIEAVARRRARLRRVILRCIAGVPFGFRLFRWALPRTLKNEYLSAGFEIRGVELQTDRIAFHVTRCLYLDLFCRYGVPELTPVFCAIDDYWYSGLEPCWYWQRQHTLARGAPSCDFRWSSEPSRRTP